MTPEQFAKIQRDSLIRAEKQSAIFLAAEFNILKREISDYLTSNLRPETRRAATAFLSEILALLDERLDVFAANSASIVSGAQRRVTTFTASALKQFLPQIESSIFSPDREAILKLIGRTQTGNSLYKFFRKFKPVVAEKAKQTLIEAFAAGESSREIARRLAAATDAERFRVLTISRTETNEAYRAASREFYQSAQIKEYIWLSVLDPRTCLTCWLLHGRKFKSKHKVFSHPNCRCVLVPVTKNQVPIITGAEHFLKLETGFQRQILGAKRLEMFETGKIGFDDFIGSRFEAQFDGSRSERFFVKNLSDLKH